MGINGMNRKQRREFEKEQRQADKDMAKKEDKCLEHEITNCEKILNLFCHDQESRSTMKITAPKPYHTGERCPLCGSEIIKTNNYKYCTNFKCPYCKKRGEKDEQIDK